MRKVLRNLRLPMLAAGLTAICAAVPADAQVSARDYNVYTLVDSIAGAVGGVAADRAGNIYVADFGDNVWKVKPDGRISLFATGFYGSSGNTIGPSGHLYQSNFYGNYVSRVDREGNKEVYASEGISGPVGVAMDAEGNLYVNNCSANSISKVLPDRSVSTFVESDLLNCPNGITLGPDSNLYVVNFSDERMLKVTPDGEISLFATLPGGGNGHVTVAGGNLIATSFRGQKVYSIGMEGNVTLIAGTGAIGEADGNGTDATFSWPNGIAAVPNGSRIYINDYVNRFPPTIARPPIPKSSIRVITPPSITQMLTNALAEGGVDGMVQRYRALRGDPSTARLFTEVEMNRLGYQLMGAGQLAAATEVFKLNVEAYPNSFNVYDSLGEAYMNAGETKSAMEFYEKSLERNASNTNAVQMLKKLRGDAG
ncbi:MAG: hypothetical protein KJO98_04400 [Rhodothermia bacterium]|nr:hypothetical protein [Rhodothermia bacterium]